MAELPAPQHRLLDGEKDYTAAIDDVIEKAVSSLHIFDIDLSAGGYQTIARYEALRRFMVRSSGKLIVVVHDTAFLERFCPRLLNLLKLYSYRISIMKTQEHGRSANDPFVIADEVHYVHRFHADGARAKIGYEDHAEARILEERFQQLVETAEPAVSATTLGL